VSNIEIWRSASFNKVFGGFVDPDDTPYSIYLKMQKYLFILGQPHLKVQVGIQRLVLRARHKNAVDSEVFTNAVPTSQSSAKVYSCEV